MSIALFGFGLCNNSEAYQYISIGDERLEAPVTPRLGPVLDIISYDNGFIVFSCAWRVEEYSDFYEYAEVTGCIDKWGPLLGNVTDVKIVNECHNQL